MNLTNQNNLTSLFISDEAPVAAGSQINDVTDLNANQIAILRGDGLSLDNATIVAAEKFFVAANNNGRLVKSPMYKINSISKVGYQKYVAPREECQYIGYDGTTGSIEVINNNHYIVDLNIKANNTLFADKDLYKTAEYYSSSADTEQNIAYYLTLNLIKNFKKETDKKLVFERVTAATRTAFTTNNVTVVNGSKSVSCTAHSLTAGTLLEINGATYVINTVVDADTFTIDIPFQGASATLDVSDAQSTYTVVVLTVPTAWGIRCTEVIPAYVQGKFGYTRYNTKITLHNFGATEVACNAYSYLQLLVGGTTVATTGWYVVQTTGQTINFGAGLANMEAGDRVYLTAGLDARTGGQLGGLHKLGTQRYGMGDYRQLRDQEWFLAGNRTDAHRIGSPAPDPIVTSIATTDKFELITIEFKDSSPTNFVGAPSAKSLVIAMTVTGDETTTTHTGANIVTYLNAAITAAIGTTITTAVVDL